MKNLRVCVASLFLFASAAVFAADDVSKINGSIRIEANQTAGDLDTVNGSIHIGDGAHADKVGTVNGSIETGDNVTARSLGTVNGAIEVGKASRVEKDVETVNGRITLYSGADVGGSLTTVNGDIRLETAHAGGGIRTVGGDISVGADSHVEGGILIEKPNTGWFRRTPRTPRVVIGPRAVVSGTLEFRREVELFVSDSAKIGNVVGATATTFSGERPPN